MFIKEQRVDGNYINLYIRDNLPNSGEPLKLLIPSHIWKYMSGWTNYSEMVTSQKIYENIMGNRGSKSDNIISVKEQRVDGSWCGNILSHLRCTLKRFERISYINFRLNQILNKQLHTTAVRNTDSKNLLEPKSSDKNTNIFSLNPWFITGFTDGDGSFSVSIAKKSQV